MQHRAAARLRPPARVGATGGPRRFGFGRGGPAEGVLLPGLCVLLALGAGTACDRTTTQNGAARPTGGGDVATTESAVDAAAGPAPDPHAWAAWVMPNPPEAKLPNGQSYDTSAADVVLDRVTALMWQRQPAPQGMLWSAANEWCQQSTVGGHDDWRLPSVIELTSLVDFTRANPAIDAAAFPDTPADSFWTSTPVATGGGIETWYVSFTTGFTYQGHQSYLAIRVRCVR